MEVQEVADILPLHYIKDKLAKVAHQKQIYHAKMFFVRHFCLFTKRDRWDHLCSVKFKIEYIRYIFAYIIFRVGDLVDEERTTSVNYRT